MSSTRKRRQKQIFLSHSGHDRALATALATALEEQLTILGHETEVFNTSEPEHRFPDFEEFSTQGGDWQQRYQQYEEELRQYITQNLLASDAYVLLVTPTSLAMSRSWIEFEVETANSEHSENFYPCFAEGADDGDLPSLAKFYQGVVIDRTKEIRELAMAIASGFH